jgi:hypothetical protein
MPLSLTLLPIEWMRRAGISEAVAYSVLWSAIGKAHRNLDVPRWVPDSSIYAGSVRSRQGLFDRGGSPTGTQGVDRKRRETAKG